MVTWVVPRKGCQFLFLFVFQTFVPVVRQSGGNQECPHQMLYLSLFFKQLLILRPWVVTILVPGSPFQVLTLCKWQGPNNPRCLLPGRNRKFIANSAFHSQRVAILLIYDGLWLYAENNTTRRDWCGDGKAHTLRFRYPFDIGHLAVDCRWTPTARSGLPPDCRGGIHRGIGTAMTLPGAYQQLPAAHPRH